MRALILTDSSKISNRPNGVSSHSILPLLDRQVIWHQLNMLAEAGVGKVAIAGTSEVLSTLERQVEDGSRFSLLVDYCSSDKLVFQWDKANRDDDKLLILQSWFLSLGLSPRFPSPDAGIAFSSVNIHDRPALLALRGGLGGDDSVCLDKELDRITLSSRPIEELVSEPVLLAGIDEFVEANLAALSGELPVFSGETREISPGIFAGFGTSVSPDARLLAPVYLGENCSVKAGVTISNAVVGHSSIIDEHSLVENAVVGPETYLGRHTEISRGFAWLNRLHHRGRPSHIVVAERFLIGPVVKPLTWLQWLMGRNEETCAL